MPLATEHSGRLRNPQDFAWIREIWRSGKGVRALGGALKSNPDGPTVTQTVRFDRDKWTPKKAKKWLKEHKQQAIRFEPAKAVAASFAHSEIELAFPTYVRRALHERSAVNAGKGQPTRDSSASTPKGGHFIWYAGHPVFIKDGAGAEHEQTSKALSDKAKEAFDKVGKALRGNYDPQADFVMKSAKLNKAASAAREESAKQTVGGTRAVHVRMAKEFAERAAKHEAAARRVADTASASAEDKSNETRLVAAKTVGDGGEQDRSIKLRDMHNHAADRHQRAAEARGAIGDESGAAYHRDLAAQHSASAAEQEEHVQGYQRLRAPWPGSPAGVRASAVSADLVRREKLDSAPLNRKAADEHDRAVDDINSATLQRSINDPQRDRQLAAEGAYHAGMRDAHRKLVRPETSPEDRESAKAHIIARTLARNNIALTLDFPVDDIELAGDDSAGHWITSNGVHIFIKDGGGAQHEQVAKFFSGHANSMSAKAHKDGSAEAHSTAAKAQHNAAAASLDAKNKAESKESASQHEGRSLDHAARAQAHAQAASKIAHTASTTAYDHAKQAVQAKADAVKSAYKAAKGLPQTAYEHVKAAIKSKLDDIKEAANARHSAIASKLHSAAANYHQIAADVHGLLGNKEKAAEHTAKANEHIAERDRHDKIVMDHAIKTGDNSLPVRIERVARARGISHEDAEKMVHEADAHHGKETPEGEEKPGDKEKPEGKKSEAPHSEHEHGEHEQGHGEHNESHEAHGGGEHSGERVRSGSSGSHSSSSGGRKKKKAKFMNPKKHLGLSLEECYAGEYMLDPMPGLLQAIALGEQTTVDGKPVRRFRKEIIREGQFQKARDGIHFEVTRKSLEHWRDTFDRMQANGVKVYFPAGHTNKPEANRGYWKKMDVAASSADPHKLALYGEVDAIGEDGIGLIGRTDVSLYSPPELIDGAGNVYKRPLVHVAACSDPVIPGLGDWAAVACALTPFDGDAEHDAQEAAAGELTNEPGKDCIDTTDLRDFMRGLHAGDYIQGVLKRWGPQDTRTDTDLRYSGRVRKVDDHATGMMPEEPMYQCTLVIYEDDKGELQTVSSSSQHTSFRKVPPDQVTPSPLVSKPTSLSLADTNAKYSEGPSAKEKADDKFVAKREQAAEDDNDSSDDDYSSSESSSDSDSDTASDSASDSSSDSSSDSEESDEMEDKKGKKLSLADGGADEHANQFKGKKMNVAGILSKLNIDVSSVTPENCETLILSGIEDLEANIEARLSSDSEARIAEEVSQRVEAERRTLSLSMGGHMPSDIEVELKTENLTLLLNGLIDGGNITPAVAKQFQKRLIDSDTLSLSISRGDDTIRTVLGILAENKPVSLTEVTGAQTKGAVRLSRKNGAPVQIKNDEDDEPDDKDILAKDAEARKEKWDADRAKQKASC